MTFPTKQAPTPYQGYANSQSEFAHRQTLKVWRKSLIGVGVTTSPFQTKKIGGILAKEILKSGSGSKAFIIGLEGDLGGGKTTFLQGFARGLGIRQKITSPTFVIMKRFKQFYHLDCYRIRQPKELLSLGFQKIISDPKNIVAVEWADRVRKIIPKNTIWLKFEFVDDKTRKITLGGCRMSAFLSARLLSRAESKK